MRSSERASRLLAVAATALASLLSAVPQAVVRAADPSPSAGGAAGDPRSAGQGPGLVGDPLFAIAVVVVIGVSALVLTLAYVRLTARHEGDDRP